MKILSPSDILPSSRPSRLRVSLLYVTLFESKRSKGFSREGAKFAKATKKKYQQSHDAGFTLLEVLVSFAVAGLVVAIVIPSSLMARQRLKSAEVQWQATQTALSLIETSVRSGKAIELQTIGDWQASGSLTSVDTEQRTRFRLARIDVTLKPRDPSQESLKHSMIRLVPVP
jgi:prepilin-type N-terminal cleavage/methylation domain-containing protein